MIDKKKVKIVSSKFGVVSISWKEGVLIPGDPPKLNKSRWTEYCRVHAHNGADETRETTWLVDGTDVLAAAFEYIKDSKAFDLSQLQNWFFNLIREMREIAESFNLVFIWTLFIWNEIKKKKYRPFNPWTNNLQGISDWTDPKAEQYWKAYVRGIVKKSKVKKLYLVNEPPDSRSLAKIHAGFLWRLTRYLVDELKFPYDNLVLGFQWGGLCWDKYQDIQKHAADNARLKYRSFSPVHNLSDEKVDWIEAQQNANRCIFASFDGRTKPMRPPNTETKRTTVNLLNISKSMKLNIEVINNLDHGGRADAARGPALGYRECYRHMPVNADKFPPVEVPIDPEPIDPVDPTKPDPIDPIKPIKEVIMQNIRDYKNFWKGLMAKFGGLGRKHLLICWVLPSVLIGAIAGVIIGTKSLFISIPLFIIWLLLLIFYKK